MHPLIPAAPNPTPPPPAPRYCGHFPALSVPGGLANLALPGGRAFTSPGAIPNLLTRMRFSTRLTTQRILLEKQAYWHICQGPKKIEEGCKGMFSILCLFVFHCISSQNHMAKSGAIRTWINAFLYNLKLNQISVDIIWRKFFHIYKTIRIATRQVSTKRLVLYFKDFRIIYRLSQS